jgi:hypothetical protein
MNISTARIQRAALLIFAALGGISPAARAQSATTGGLAGTVTDPSGTGLPEVTVSLIHAATGQAQTAATSTSGSYSFSLLSPGSYAVRFAAPGHKASVMPGVVVNIAETPTLDATLEPGATAEPVPCNCRLSMATSATATVVDSKTITAVPLTTRNITQVLSMTSGSAADVNNAGTLGRGTRSVNVNGNTSAGAYTLDGAYAPSAVPNPDTISELKIQTSQYDAVYGAQVPNTALITKSGENEWHGDVWEFVRNDIFNANSFFRNSTGQSKPNLKQNQYGATLGGPIRHNKLFFFSSYQGTRQTNGLDQTSTSNPILPPLTADRSAAALATQFCPGNHLLSSGQPDPRYLTYAGGKQLDCANRGTATTAPISAVALRLLQARNPDGNYLIPIPQTIFSSGANAGLGFSSYSQPSFYHENQVLLNTDYLASAKNTVTGRVYLTGIDQFRTMGSPQGYPGTPIVPGMGTPQALQAHDYVGSVGLTSALTRTLVNEARFSFTRTRQDAHGDQTPTATSLGMTPADKFFDQPPEMNILGPLGSFRVFGNFGNDFAVESRYYSFSDNFSWVHGKHRTRTGGFFLPQDNFRDDLGNARGRITFQTFSDFLVGLSAADNASPAGRSNIQSIFANESVGPLGQLQYHYRSYYGAGFVQDDYKIRPRLTLNLGLRWEYVGPALDTTGAMGNVWPSLLREAAIPPIAGTLAGNTVAANYDATLVNPYTGKPFGAPPAGVLVRDTKSYYQNSAPLDTFAPRFGFAWQPFGGQGRIALRGGYGLFYQAPTYSGNAGGAPLFTAAPFAQGFSNADASNNFSSFERPFPGVTLGYVPRTLTSQLSDRIAGPEYVVPRLHQWNFSTQLRFSHSLSLDIGYVGTEAHDLLLARGLNQPLLASAAAPVNCGYDGVASHCITANTSQNAMFRVPILGETPTALAQNEFAGSSAYHSLQTTFRKQASHGLTFQTTYTYSRAANNTSLYNDPNNLSLDWGRASFDRTHRFTTNFDYPLPAFRTANGLTGAMLHGWTLAGIIIGQSGLPMTLTDPNGGGVYGHAATSTATLCPGASYGSLVTPGGVTDRLGRWIDSTALCAPAAIGADGSTGYGTSGQSILTGPAQFNTDFSVGKTTRVGGLREDAVLAFRMEMYNALNHPQFSNPGTAMGTATFGVITQNSVAPRLIQFALKYLF